MADEQVTPLPAEPFAPNPTQALSGRLQITIRARIKESEKPRDCCRICFFGRTRTIEGIDYLCCCENSPLAVSSLVDPPTKAQWSIVDPDADWCGDGMDGQGRPFRPNAPSVTPLTEDDQRTVTYRQDRKFSSEP